MSWHILRAAVMVDQEGHDPARAFAVVLASLAVVTGDAGATTAR
jgi:hypothetical protein